MSEPKPADAPIGPVAAPLAATPPVTNADPSSLVGGGFPAWPLPMEATAAEVARSAVKAVFGALRMPADLTYDMAVGVSELATNVYVHAPGGGAAAGVPVAGLPELWAYLRWGARPAVVLKVFDSAPWRGRTTYGSLRPSATSESGRGFEVVHALTVEYGGRWGIHRTRSRLGARQVAGKAVFLTVPLPPGHPAASTRPMPKSSHQVAEELHGLLAARGLGRIQAAADRETAVICVRAGLHVWVREQSISYRAPGGEPATHPLCDGVEVVEEVVRHCADLDAGPPTPSLTATWDSEEFRDSSTV